MTIPLTTKRTPALKLPDVGDTVIVAIAHEAVVPLYAYSKDGSKIRARTRDGSKERNQLKLTVVVVSGKAVTGPDLEPVMPGDEAVIFLDGHNWFSDKGFSYVEATKKLGGVNVGDVMQWKFEREEAGQGGFDKKIRSTTLRHAKPDEAATVAQCEEIYRRIVSTPLPSATPDYDDTEDPF